MKTHINDVTAYNLGFRFAVLNSRNHCVGYYKDSKSAYANARSIRGSKIVHLTGNKSPEVLKLERNGFKTDVNVRGLRRNPIKDFTLPDTYIVPKTTMERVKESLSPGLRNVAGKPEYGFKDDTTWPIPDVVIPAPKGKNYLPHQIAGISAMLHRKNVLLADEQGLGKTIEIAGYINAIHPDRTLIVCPTIAMENWYDELREWIVDKSMVILIYQKDKFCTISYKKVEGETKTIYTPISNQDNPKWNIVITNYNAFRKHATQEEKQQKEDEIPIGATLGPSAYQIPVEAARGKRGRPKKGEEKPKKTMLNSKTREVCKKFEKGGGLDLLVLDEVHKTKKNLIGKEAQWYMALFGEPEDPTSESEPYEGLSSFAERKIFASGTPIVNKHPKEMWGALQALDRETFPHIRVFEDEFGGKKRKSAKGDYSEIEEAKNEEILGIKLRDTILIRRKADDVLELPELIRQKIQVKETPAVEAARALLMEMLGIDSEDEIEDAVSGLKGADVDEDEIEIEFSEESEKIDAEDGKEKNNELKYTAADIAMLLSDETLSVAERIDLQKALLKLEEQEEATIAKGRAAVAFEDITKARAAMDKAKALQFDYIYEQAMEQTEGLRLSDKVVVFYEFDLAGTIIHRILTRKMGFSENQIVRIDGQVAPELRGTLVKSFKTNPNVKIFLATIRTCDTAITLTCSNVSIFMGLDYRPSAIMQAEKRTHRFTPQRLVENVFCFSAYAKNSIDGGVFNALLLKKGVQRKVLDTFPTEKQIEEYETTFRTPKLYGAKYSLTQRTLIKQMLLEILKKYAEAKKGKDVYSLLDKYNLSYYDLDRLYSLKDEFDAPEWRYDGKKPERSDKFPENLIDNALPIMWKLRTLADTRTLYSGGPNSVDFPTSITGIQKNLFKPLKSGTYDYQKSSAGNNYLHQLLYLATLPVRKQAYAAAAAGGGRRRRGEETDDLIKIAQEGE